MSTASKVSLKAGMYSDVIGRMQNVMAGRPNPLSREARLRRLASRGSLADCFAQLRLSGLNAQGEGSVQALHGIHGLIDRRWPGRVVHPSTRHGEADSRGALRRRGTASRSLGRMERGPAVMRRNWSPEAARSYSSCRLRKRSNARSAARAKYRETNEDEHARRRRLRPPEGRRQAVPPGFLRRCRTLIWLPHLDKKL